MRRMYDSKDTADPKYPYCTYSGFQVVEILLNTRRGIATGGWRRGGKRGEGDNGDWSGLGETPFAF